MKGTVFNIQRFSLHDGPGIRTCVFLKGCPLRCGWCHNPESHMARPELMFSPDKCTLCGKCAFACPRGLHHFDGQSHEIRRDMCTACGECASACPHGALDVAGQVMSLQDVMATVLRDVDFYRDSGGGLTLSGGEPLFRLDFALALLQSARDSRLHTCVETSAYCPWDTLERTLPLVDLYLVDWKVTDSALHRQYTGVGNERIRENIISLVGSGAHVVLRCPIIPDVNFTSGHLRGIIDLATEIKGLQAIDLEPYHPLGLQKALRLGKSMSYQREAFLESGALADWADALRRQTGLPVNVS